MIDQSCKFFVRPILLIPGAFLLVASTTWAQAPAISWSLDEAIHQIERQAKDFDTAMARIEKVEVASDGTEIDNWTGTGFFREDGSIRYNVDGGQRVTLVDKNTVSKYNAETKTVEEYSLRSHKDRLEPFVRLGFSTTGSDMKKDYLITVIGEEKIGDSRTVVLELTPEKDSVRETVRLIRLYVDQASWMPVRQVFKATKDNSTVTMTYTGMARNLKLKSDLFKEKWPKGTEKVRK